MNPLASVIPYAKQPGTRGAWIRAGPTMRPEPALLNWKVKPWHVRRHSL